MRLFVLCSIVTISTALAASPDAIRQDNSSTYSWQDPSMPTPPPDWALALEDAADTISLGNKRVLPDAGYVAMPRTDALAAFKTFNTQLRRATDLLQTSEIMSEKTSSLYLAVFSRLISATSEASIKFGQQYRHFEPSTAQDIFGWVPETLTKFSAVLGSKLPPSFADVLQKLSGDAVKLLQGARSRFLQQWFGTWGPASGN